MRKRNRTVRTRREQAIRAVGAGSIPAAQEQAQASAPKLVHFKPSLTTLSVLEDFQNGIRRLCPAPNTFLQSAAATSIAEGTQRFLRPFSEPNAVARMIADSAADFVKFAHLGHLGGGFAPPLATELIGLRLADELSPSKEIEKAFSPTNDWKKWHDTLLAGPTAARVGLSMNRLELPTAPPRTSFPQIREARIDHALEDSAKVIRENRALERESAAATVKTAQHAEEMVEMLRQSGAEKRGLELKMASLEKQIQRLNRRGRPSEWPRVREEFLLRRRAGTLRGSRNKTAGELELWYHETTGLRMSAKTIANRLSKEFPGIEYRASRHASH